MKSANAPRIAGIVMECNPFHEGHQYILEQARAITGAEAVVVVLSGDYVQRGIPAVYSKESRTRQLLFCGADLVLELPVCCAVSSAEFFAQGAVHILQEIGIVTDLVFGSESGDLEHLAVQAQFFLHESSDYQRLLRELLSKGLSYPAARQQAAATCSAHLAASDTANDILGVEYLKALLSYGCSNFSDSAVGGRSSGSLLSNGSSFCLQPHAVPRITAVSATQHRQRLLDNHDPSCLFADDFSELLLARLLSIHHDPQRSFADYAGISSDLSDRIERLLPEYVSWTQFCQLLKTRNITYSAVSRAMVHILLNMTAEYETFCRPSYARVLGCRRDAMHLLGDIAKSAPDFLLITNPARQRAKESSALTAKAPSALKSLSLDLRASELYDYLSRRKAINNKIPAADSAAARISEYAKPFLVV